MRLFMALTLLSLTIHSFAKDKIDYTHCQESVDKMFQLETIPGQKLPNVFKIDEEGNLQANDDYVKLSKYDEETGEYVFRTKAKGKKSFSLFADDAADNVRMYNYTVKKDDQGRVYSIEALGLGKCENCKQRIDIAYSKDKCMPKRIYATNSDEMTTVTADAESCRSLAQIQKDLFKEINKANKCLDKLNDFYQKTAEVSDVLISKIAEQPEWAKNLQKGIFAEQLDKTKNNASALKEKDNVAIVREQQQQALQENFNLLLTACQQHYGKDLLDDTRVFKKQSSLYEIKKENIGQKVDNPLQGIKEVKQE